MIARIKKTGKIIDVVPYGDEFAQLFPEGDFKVYTKDELDFRADVDWQQVRIQASIAAMQAYISDGERMALVSKKFDYDDKVISKFIAEGAAMYADALIAELKKGGQDDNHHQ